MSAFHRMRDGIGKAWPFEVLPRTDWGAQTPSHVQADPRVIAAALERSQRRPSGNWFVIGASTDIASEPHGAVVAGADLVCWRDGTGTLHAGPARCPHLGADLCTGAVDRGHLVCPWHGLRLTGRDRPDWPSVPVFDGDRITLQSVRSCQQVFSSAFIAHVETTYGDDATRNELCTPIVHPDAPIDYLRQTLEDNVATLRWVRDDELMAWLKTARLNAARDLFPVFPPGKERVRDKAMGALAVALKKTNDELIALMGST